MKTATQSNEDLLLELKKLQKEHHDLKQKHDKEISALKQIVKTLELKEQQRQAILQSSSSGFLRLDKQGWLLEVNNAYCQLSGYSEPELLSMHIADLSINVNRQTAGTRLKQIKSNGHYCFESQHRRKDGHIFDVEARFHYLDINGGQFVGFTTDITDRKKSHNKLLARKQMFKEVMQNSPIGMALVRPDGHILEANPAFCSMLGYSKEELINTSFQQVTYPEDLQADLNLLNQALNGEITKYQMEKRYLHQNQSIIWALLSVTLVRNEDGSPKYFIAQIQDITKRKHAEQALKASHEKYRLIAEHMGTIVTISDMNLHLSYVSPSVKRILGYSPDEYLNIGLSQVMTHESKKKVHAILAEEKRLEQSGEADLNRSNLMEVEVFSKAGHKVWLEINSSYIRDKHDTPISILSVSHDITERKTNELQLLHLIRIEELYNDISYHFARSNYQETDALIYAALKKIGLFIDVDRAYVFLLDKDESRISNTHEWCKEGIEPQAPYLQQLPVAAFSWWMDQMNEFKLIKYNTITDLPVEAAAEQSMLEKQHVVSILALPMVYENQLQGFIGFDAVKQKKNWQEQDVKVLQALADLISGEIVRTKRMHELLASNQKAIEHKNKFKKLSNLTFEGILVHNNGIAYEMNKSLTKLTGYTRKDLLGQNVIELAVPQKYLSRVYQNMSKDYAAPYEIEIIKKDGSLLSVELESKNITDKQTNSRATRVLALRDIRWRKAAEKEIQKLTMAVEQSANIIIITDVNGLIEYTNPRFTEVTGYSANEVHKKHVRLLGSGKQPKAHYTAMWETISAGKSWKGLFNNKKKNGEYYWEQATITPIKNEANEIVNYLTIKEDITTLRKNEQQLKIQNIELLKAKEKAEESDKLKSAFLANMSHEIRTPMNSILGFTNLLLEPDLTSEQREDFIKIVHQSGQRMLNTVNDIIEISKIEAGIVPVYRNEIDLNERTQALIRFFKPEAERKGLQLITEQLLPPQATSITTDPNKLDSILTNLIKNAIKFTPSGTITVGCQRNGSKVEFHIKDTGVGIPKHRIKAIFNRFEQADAANKRAFEGSGLGLAISKSYVEMLGGKIWPVSEEGKGTVFYFYIIDQHQ